MIHRLELMHQPFGKQPFVFFVLHDVRLLLKKQFDVLGSSLFRSLPVSWMRRLLVWVVIWSYTQQPLSLAYLRLAWGLESGGNEPCSVKKEHSQSTSLELVQPVNLLGTSLILHGRESHRRVASFSHCPRFQFPSWEQLWRTTSTLYRCCLLLCIRTLASKHDQSSDRCCFDFVSFAFCPVISAALPLVLKNGGHSQF